jgi:hypothetical protein
VVLSLLFVVSWSVDLHGAYELMALSPVVVMPVTTGLLVHVDQRAQFCAPDYIGVLHRRAGSLPG